MARFSDGRMLWPYGMAQEVAADRGRRLLRMLEEMGWGFCRNAFEEWWGLYGFLNWGGAHFEVESQWEGVGGVPRKM